MKFIVEVKKQYMINLSSSTRKSVKCRQTNCSWNLVASRMVRTQFYGALNLTFLSFLKLDSINHHPLAALLFCVLIYAFVFYRRKKIKV